MSFFTELPVGAQRMEAIDSMNFRMCVGVVFVFGTGIVLAQESRPMTLKEAVALARRNAFSVITAEADARATSATIDQARAATLPYLTFDATYQRFDREIAVEFDPMSPPIVVRPVDRKSLQLNLTQRVDLFGLYRLGVSGTQSLQSASSRRVVAAMNDAATAAKSAFFQVLKAQEFVAVAEEQLAAAKEHLRVAEQQYEAGRVAKFDVIRFQSEVSAAEQALIQANNNLSLAKAGFNFALARDTATPVELVKPAGLPTVARTIEDLIDVAKETRPEILAAKDLVEYQLKYRQAREREGWPSLNISANYSRDPDASGFGSAKDTLSATAFLSFPIFEGGLIRARVKQAKAEEEKAKISFAQIGLAVEVEVRREFFNVEAAKKMIESTEKNVEVAREALRLAELRYREGVGTPLEVADATASFTRARTAHVNAVYDYWDAVARLQRAVGTEDV